MGLGAIAPMFSVTMVRTTSFSIYQKMKYKYSAAIGRATGGDEPLVVVNKPGSTPTLATIACFGAAGGTAGASIVVLACMLEAYSKAEAYNHRPFRADQIVCPNIDVDGESQHVKHG